MKTFFKDLLSSNSGVSSKRLVTLVAFLLMATGFIANLFWDLTIDANIYDSMQWIVIGGLGFTASEIFAYKGKTESTEEPVIDDDEPRVSRWDSGRSKCGDETVRIKKRGE